MNRLIVFLLILAVICFGQSGNLIHIHADSDSVNAADTLSYWVKDIEEVNSYYFDVISSSSKDYLIRYEVWKPERIPGHRMMEIEEIYTDTRKKCSFVDFIDFVGPTYHIPPNSFPIETGVWLFDDVLGLSFLSNSDTLYSGYRDYYFSLPELYHICGKVDNRYFVMARQDDDLYFALADLSASPEYDLSELNRLNFSVEDRPIAIQKASSDLFLIRVRDDLRVYTFEADTFAYKKTLLSPVFFDRFQFRNDTLYFKNDAGLDRYFLSYADTTLVDHKILMEQVNFIDHDFRYALSIDQDSLHLYNIPNEAVQKSWDVSTFHNPHRPIMQYPDLFFHIAYDTLGTSVNFSKQDYQNKPVFKAYPNPFNSSVQFILKINQPGQSEFSIYNISGQKVYSKNLNLSPSETLNFRWTPTNVASGIYWAGIDGQQSDSHIKIIYLK